MRAVVTGGGGFVGRAIVEAALARGHSVTVLARRPYPELEALGARTVQADLSAPSEALDAALEGVDVAFHVAAKTGVWGPRADFVAANVTATKNVVDACKKAGVRRLVFTSSPSVTFDGRDAEGVSEAEVTYAEHFHALYPETKAEAERLALAENGPDLAVCALRPHLVWGPRDPHIFPRIIDRARKGRLRRVGPGTNRVDLTHVDNAALAHLLAAEALAPGAAPAGKAYFVSDGSPVNLWSFVERLLLAVGVEPPRRSVSAATAYRAGAVLETAWRLLSLPGEPPMTRFVARELATSHYYDISAAERDFGYRPSVDLEAAFEETVAAFRAREAGRA